MTVSICPYCRGAIEPQEANELLCPACAAPHHADCYAENAGCTVFGCTAAPGEEPKLHLTGTDLNAVSAPQGAAGDPFSLPTVGPTSLSAATSVRVKAAPPPMPNTPAMPPAISVPLSRFGSGSVLFGSQPVAAVATGSASANSMTFTFAADPDAKNRMTFIILGVLLGPLGAHNFFAGYHRKAIAQLLITLLTLGFAGPMMWVWAVIDVWTVDRDSNGIKFRS
jgi:TM2 domain-containing membrane protein YozV